MKEKCARKWVKKNIILTRLSLLESPCINDYVWKKCYFFNWWIALTLRPWLASPSLTEVSRGGRKELTGFCQRHLLQEKFIRNRPGSGYKTQATLTSKREVNVIVWWWWPRFLRVGRVVAIHIIAAMKHGHFSPLSCLVFDNIHVSVRHWHDTHTTFYILNITDVHVCLCPCRVRCPCRCWCFIA